MLYLAIIEHSTGTAIDHSPMIVTESVRAGSVEEARRIAGELANEYDNGHVIDVCSDED